ncbi:unnamed protein product [Linum trigynum]|uniref:C2H2-type domain-containing protein n=1 Tax=Linum trigynum TaxID=586398 RepID=A0AAV2DNF8_9ROSI
MQQGGGGGGGGDLTLTMANCLMLLSQATADHHNRQYDAVGVNFNSTTTTSSSSEPSRVFECKTCNRQFPSFQALGGHRASHKKPRGLAAAGSPGGSYDVVSSSSPVKPKTHECSICGLEFSIGQALGGHMRRHRGSRAAAASSSESHESPGTPPPRKRARVLMMMGLDLNLTPFENDARMFKLGKAEANSSPMVDCFY